MLLSLYTSDINRGVITALESVNITFVVCPERNSELSGGCKIKCGRGEEKREERERGRGEHGTRCDAIFRML
jgi:hypothetical protein